MISVEDDKGDSLWCDLVGISRIKTPVPDPSPNLTDFTKIDGSYGLLDCNSVEFLISWKSPGTTIKDIEYVELHFASGKTFIVFADSLDTKGGGYGVNVVVDFINRYNRNK